MESYQEFIKKINFQQWMVYFMEYRKLKGLVYLMN